MVACVFLPKPLIAATRSFSQAARRSSSVATPSSSWSLPTFFGPTNIPQLEAFALNQSMWPGAPDQWVLPELSPAQLDYAAADVLYRLCSA